MTIAQSNAVSVVRERDMVVLVIHGQGALTLPRQAAHGIASEIMRVIADIDRDNTAAARRFP